jgi:spore photoproduct lyase
MQTFIPKRAFFEQAALDYPLGQNVYNRLQTMGVTIHMTGSHNRVTGIPGTTDCEAYREAKNTLVVGVRKSIAFSSCKPSAHYQLPLTTSCPGMCEYCYLATTLGKRPYLRIYVNVDEILAKAQAYIDERQPNVTIFEGAATSDPIPTEYLTGLLAKTIKFFAGQQLGRFRFVTKFTDVDSLLDVKHNEHTRFRFSLNAPTVIDQYEHNTTTLADRIAAAGKVVRAGYPLGFIIAPIFHFPGWREEYGRIFRLLAEELPSGVKDMTFEFITHRFTKRAKTNILNVFSHSMLPMNEKERKYKYGQFGYGKYIYQPEKIAEIKHFMQEQINAHFSGAKIEYLV